MCRTPGGRGDNRGRADRGREPRAMTPPDTPEETEIEVLLRKDRENLNSFVKNLNRGVDFDDLDVDLQVWWLNRY
jgi:hypothetical protein